MLVSKLHTTDQNYSFVREKLHPAPPRKLLFLQKHPCVISWLLPCKKAGKSCFDGNKSPATNASNITLTSLKLENLTILFPCWWIKDTSSNLNRRHFSIYFNSVRSPFQEKDNFQPVNLAFSVKLAIKARFRALPRCRRMKPRISGVLYWPNPSVPPLGPDLRGPVLETLTHKYRKGV